MDPIFREQSSAIGMPLIPEGVAFTDRSPKSELGRQIVVRFDDSRDLVIIEGYVDPTQLPVLTVEREFRVPTLRPQERELLRQIAESNLQLGASAQAF
jgi:molybdopterin-guanine dinucleotide biosynthesis protein